MSELWNRLDPGFFAPVWLAVGLVAMIAVTLLELGSRRRRRQDVRQFASPHLVSALTGSVSHGKRALKRILLICAVGLLFVAMARPHLFYGWREESRTGLDILLAVDCSKSMLTQDVKPSRLERAKLAISDFAERLPDHRLGLIAFAGDAFLQCPLTFDHEAFLDAVQELDTDTIPRPGTDIAIAIRQAIEALHSQSSNLKFLILITDGEDLENHALEAAREAAQAGLRIYTVGVGTPEGAPIPDADDSGAVAYHHDDSGQIIKSSLDESTLRQIAEISGGAYVPLGRRGEGLDEIYNRYISTLPKQILEERREKIRIERFEWPLGLAILLLMLEFVITERARTTFIPQAGTGSSRRQIRGRVASAPTLSACLLASLVLWPGTSASASTTDTAEKDYKAGQYSDAAQNYKKSVDAQPNRNDLIYNLGDASYKAGNYTEAEDAFRKTLNTGDLGLQENAYFNLGNAQFKHGETMQGVDKQKTIDLWEKALTSYSSALKLKPSADARHNYEVVKKKLEELKKQQQQQSQGQNKDNQSQPNNSRSGSNSKQGQGKGGDQQQQPNQPEQNNPQNGDQNNSQSPQQQGGKQEQNKPPGSPDQTNNGQQPGANGSKSDTVKAYSGTRNQDKNDPGAKSREEAEALLDSLKDDEHHVTARTLNGNNQPPPPPPSGKDW